MIDPTNRKSKNTNTASFDFSTLSVHQYNGVSISQVDVGGIGYINLTQMAKAAGKRVDNWLRLHSTKELIEVFDTEIASLDLRKQFPALVTMTSGVKGERGGGGTWAHPDIAIQFAQKCNPEFALQVSRWTRERMTRMATGKTQLSTSSLYQTNTQLDSMRADMVSYIDTQLSEIKETNERLTAEVDQKNQAIRVQTEHIHQLKQHLVPLKCIIKSANTSMPGLTGLMNEAVNRAGSLPSVLNNTRPAKHWVEELRPGLVESGKISGGLSSAISNAYRLIHHQSPERGGNGCFVYSSHDQAIIIEAIKGWENREKQPPTLFEQVIEVVYNSNNAFVPLVELVPTSWYTLKELLDTAALLSGDINNDQTLLSKLGAILIKAKREGYIKESEVERCPRPKYQGTETVARLISGLFELLTR
ncbi:MAG: KilA-N domain-containing protein [Cyanobacteria bacterium P01_H01_bin.105]